MKTLGILIQIAAIIFGIVANMSVLILLSIFWFGFGIIGTGIVHYWTYKKITWQELFIILSLGSLFGFIAFSLVIQDFRERNCNTKN